MVIIKTKTFDRWAKKADVPDAALFKAVTEIVAGLIDANLGGSVYKKRVATKSKGKSGSVRTLLATNLGDRWFFMFGFEKKTRSNISGKELEVVKMLANDLLSLDDDEIKKAIKNNVLIEVNDER